MGSADHRVRPAPLWAHWLTPRAQGLPTAINFEILGARSNFASKDVRIYFSKDFNARKYFWIFVKNGKSARNVSSMHECFENSNMHWKNGKKSRKAKW